MGTWERDKRAFYLARPRLGAVGRALGVVFCQERQIRACSPLASGWSVQPLHITLIGICASANSGLPISEFITEVAQKSILAPWNQKARAKRF